LGGIKPADTVENRAIRSKLGRFVKGCKPGPGRPRSSRPLPDEQELLVDALLLDHVCRAWKFIIDRYDVDACVELARLSHGRGQHVPEFVCVALDWWPAAVVRR
jgi:hypothetical protein